MRTLVQVGWRARTVDGTHPGSSTIAVDRTAVSHALAAARHRERWADEWSQDVEESRRPARLNDARRYYSTIGGESADPVSVFTAADGEEVSSATPGTPCLHLEPRFRLVRVLDADGREEGVIRSEGIVPGVRYVMRRNGYLVWVFSVRSIVRKRHTLEPADGETWTFDTPFFWWQHLTGTACGVPKLVGYVGPTKRVWLMWIEPGRDTHDLLAAVAFMHRKWWRW